MKLRDKKFSVISVLGSGTGEPNQVFKHIVSPDEVWIQESARRPAQRWHAVKNLSESNENSRHYKVDRDSGKIEFGDGERGRIPPSGSDVVAVYRQGVDEQGIIAGKTAVLRGVGTKPDNEQYIETETHQTSSGYKSTFNFGRKEKEIAKKKKASRRVGIAPAFQRDDYFYGKLLTVSDFETEQQYFKNKRKEINTAIREFKKESCLVAVLLQVMSCLNWKMKGRISISVTRNRVTVRREPDRRLPGT
jgi:hypothetical protein